MDSWVEEDVTLPGTLSGCSVFHPVLPSDLDGINDTACLEKGVLPNVSEEKVSPTRARNMKDFENQIAELKKENFNLKLRIYFLEERMQQEFAGPTEHIYKTNVELKVEVESLKRELQEKDQLLVKASKAVESLAEGGGSEIQRMKEDSRKVQQLEDLLTERIRILEEDVKAAQAELEKAFAETETEKALRLSLENKLSVMQKMQEGDLEMTLALEEKDRLIEELKLSLKSKEALIQCLKEEKSQMASPDEDVSTGELGGLSATLSKEKERDVETAQREWQKERNHFEEKIQALQEDLREKEREIAAEKKNSLKRDKAIQGLTMALKSKEKEVEELNSKIKELTTAFTEAREAPLKIQATKFQGSEEYEAALMEKEALLAELHSENITKNTENHRLLRNVKKVTQELNDLTKEKLRLERDLEEAHQEGSKQARTIHDLRNEVEKLRNEMSEREKLGEKPYKNLLDERNTKFHTQEQAVRCLTESGSQKDLMLQNSNEKDLEAIQQNHCLMMAEELKIGSDGLITAKCSQQSPDSKPIFSKEKQQSAYEGLTGDLKMKQSIYAHLAKTLQDSDSVSNPQAELKEVLALWKQLEQDVLACRNLQKVLQEQLGEIQRREGKLAGVEQRPQSDLLERLRPEEDNLAYQNLLPESPEPSTSHVLSDDEMSEKSSLSRDQKTDNEPEKHTAMESHFPQGSTNVSAYGSDLHNSLTSEIHFLRKQIQALSTMLEKGSRDKQKENEKLSRKAASLEHLQLEYTSVREENERLQRDLSEKERHNQQLTQEVYSNHQELSRVQEEMQSRQQLLSQKDKLLQSLRMELKVYEKLDEEHRKLQRAAQGEASGEGWKGPDSFSNLHGLLTEIQALRGQLERSIQTNSTLSSKLEEQLLQGSKKAQEEALTLAVKALSVTEWSLQLDKNDGSKCPEASDNSFDLFESTQAMAPKSASETPLLSRTDVDSLSCDSSTSATSPPCMPCLVADHHVWASKSGHHMLGLIEDYDTLHKQISRGQRLLAKMDIQTQETLSFTSQKLEPKGPQSVPLSKFLSSVSTAKLILEEALRLLTLFWRVSVPTDGQYFLHYEQIEEMKAEITKLQEKVFEQEKKLQSTSKLLQQKEHQEKVICDQLVITHQVLQKARRNLERRTRTAHPGSASPSRPGS